MKKIVLFITLCLLSSTVGFSQSMMQGADVYDNVHKEAQFHNELNNQINWRAHNRFALLAPENQNRSVNELPLLNQSNLHKLPCNSESYYGLLSSASIASPVIHNSYPIFQLHTLRVYQLKW